MTLDIFLPDVEGWRVLERLKNDIATRHIPTCVISTDDSRERAIRSGALAFVSKPIQSKEKVDELLDFLKEFVGRSTKNLLMIEPDPTRQEKVFECIRGDDLEVTTVPDGRTALDTLRSGRFDCIVISRGYLAH
jgi:CheY-like chemotaxis protein